MIIGTLSRPDAEALVITLRQRVVDALTKPTTAAELRSCIAHTQADLGRCEREKSGAEAKAVDPLATDEDATEGKRICLSLGFDIERLRASQTRLEARLVEVADDEAEEGRRAAYDAVLVKRDAVAEKLKEVYPRAVGELGATLRELLAVELKVREVNANKPRGAAHVVSAEEKARGVMGINTAGGPWSVVSRVHMPAAFGSEGLFRGGPAEP